jgi:hypothetical protein
MNSEDIPEYLGGSFRTNNYITCRHLGKFSENVFFKEKKLSPKKKLGIF